MFGKSALGKTIGRNPKRAARCCRPASIRFRMIPLLGRLTLCGICRVATIGASQKQIFRHFCNFFAIRDSFLFPQSGNRLLNSRLPALLHRDLRSGESITIPNRKKVAIRAVIFVFSLPATTSGRCRGRGDLESALRDDLEAAKVMRCGMTRARCKFDTAG